MKVAVASDDGKAIAKHFGRTRGFMIYDVDIYESEGKKINSLEFRENTFTDHAQGLEHANHSRDRHTTVLTALADCTVVISHGIGKRLYDDLATAGIEAIITDMLDAQGAVEAYLSGELTDHPERGCCHHG